LVCQFFPFIHQTNLRSNAFQRILHKQQQNTLNKSIKSGIIRNLELNATDPLVQANLDKIKQTPGYSSQGNVAPGGAGPTGPEGPAGPSQNNTQQTDAPTSADTTAALAGLANNGGIASDQQKTFEDDERPFIGMIFDDILGSVKRNSYLNLTNN